MEFDRPADPYAPAPRREGGDALMLDVLSILGVLRRRLLLVGLIAFLFVAGTITFALSLTPIFSATTQVLFDPTVRQPFDDPNRPSRSAQGSEIVDSQISVITSDAVLRPVARDNNLAEDPNFGAGAPGLVGQLKQLFGGTAKTPESLEAAETGAVEALYEATGVKRLGQTFVLNISVESPSPTQAAVLANAVAESYLADQKRQVNVASGEVATQIDERLIDLRERLRRAESEIQKFRADNRLQSADEGQLLSEQGLAGLNARLTDARAALAESTAKYEEIQRVLSSAAGAESISDAVNSETISSLRQQYATAARTEADLLADLLPSHPSVVRAKSQLERLRSLIRDEVRRIAESARIDRQVNQERVAKLQQQLDSNRTLSDTDEAASIKLRELETEAQATRTLYEIALSRAKEISELDQVVLPTARVITPAVAPDAPVYPKKKLMVLLAGVLGLLVGTAIAIGGEAFRIARRHLLPDGMPANDPGLPRIAHRPRPAATVALAGAQGQDRASTPALLRAVEQAGPGRPRIGGLREIGSLPWLDGPRGRGMPVPQDTIGLVQDTIERYADGDDGPNWLFAQGVDRIVSDILKTTSDHPARITMLTSPTLGHGQTVTAFALALSAAQRDLNVLLADGEPKQRMLSQDLNIDEDDHGGPLYERVMDYGGLGISFVSLVSGLPKYKHHRMTMREAFEFADIARDFDLVIVDGVALPQLAEDDPLAGLATGFLVTVADPEAAQISMPILARDLMTIAGDRPTGLVRTMTGRAAAPRRKYA